MQGGNKCVTAATFTYGSGDFTKAPENECDTDCETDKSMKCGSAARSSIYEIKGSKYFEHVGSCARKALDDYRLFQEDVRCTNYKDLGNRMSLEECTNLSKTDAGCKDGLGYFTFGFT